MVMISSWFLALTLLTFLLCLETSLGDKLVFVAEYARHGARYPSSEMFPWIRGKGYLLSPAGMRQHYILGRALRRRYIEVAHFLSEYYDPREVRVRTSNAKRTIESAYAQLAGLYPPGTGPQIKSPQTTFAVPPNKFDYSAWTKDLGNAAVNHTFQPIPLNSMGGVEDYLMTPSGDCPGVAKTVRKFASENADERHLKDKEFEWIYKELAAAFGIPVEDIDIYKTLTLRDVLISALWEGHPIKDEKTTMRLMNITAIVDRYYSYRFYFNVSQEDWMVSKVLATPILREIAGLARNATTKVEINRGLKFAMFLGHDNLMDAMLRQLGINATPLVPFAAVLLFEVYQRADGVHYVRIRYDDEYNGTLSMDEFSALVDDCTYSAEKFALYCAAAPVPAESQPHRAELAVTIFCVLLAVFVLLISLVTFFRYRRDTKIESGEYKTEEQLQAESEAITD